MKLTKKDILDRKKWQEKGYKLPNFDMEEVTKRTLEEPTWMHFGAGNLFRAFTAAAQNKLLNEGKAYKGIIVAEGYDYELIERVYKPYNDLSLLVTLKPDGNIEKEVIGSVVRSIAADSKDEGAWEELKKIFRAPSLQMASFTITEKGYSVTDGRGEILPMVERDVAGRLEAPEYFMGKLTSLCYERYRAGGAPIALVSMDNCSHNGTKLYEAVSYYAKEWVERGAAEGGFLDYITDSSRVAFPWSMIDKITPRPDELVRENLEKTGFADTEIVITDKNSYSASFVNAEEPQYLVIEDNFPNGRPNLDEAGIIFTDRGTVDRVERMKVCTCLNPLHTALAIYGCLLEHNSIAEEMKDEELRSFIERIAYDEAIKVVTDPKILNPSEFIREVMEVRFPNPFLPDTPQRIATDTSQKIAIRFGETIKAYHDDNRLDAGELKMIPLVVAGWCRYLMGIDDSGNRFDLSPDPLLEQLVKHVEGIELGYEGDIKPHLEPILSDEKLMGMNLYEAGLGERIEVYFRELIGGRGAVRATLKKYLKN